MKKIMLSILATLGLTLATEVKAEDPLPSPTPSAELIESSITEADRDAEDESLERAIVELRDEFKRNKAAFVGNAMNLTPEESAKFWEIYAEYDKERTKIGDRRLALLKDYTSALPTMTEMKAKELSKTQYEIQKDLLDLRYKYVGKFQKAMNPIIAARFSQVELQTQLLMDLTIVAHVPLIERPVN